MLVAIAPYALGCVLALGMAWRSRSWDAMMSAAILALGWLASNAAYLANALDFWPAVDLAIALFALDQVRAGWTAPEWWTLAFLVLAVDQLFLDAAYGVFGAAAYYPYTMAANLTFVMQLMAVGWIGGGDVCNMLLRGFRGICGLGRQAHAQVEMTARD